MCVCMCVYVGMYVSEHRFRGHADLVVPARGRGEGKGARSRALRVLHRLEAHAGCPGSTCSGSGGKEITKSPPPLRSALVFLFVFSFYPNSRSLNSLTGLSSTGGEDIKMLRFFLRRLQQRSRHRVFARARRRRRRRGGGGPAVRIDNLGGGLRRLSPGGAKLPPSPTVTGTARLPTNARIF